FPSLPRRTGRRVDRNQALREGAGFPASSPNRGFPEGSPAAGAPHGENDRVARASVPDLRDAVPRRTRSAGKSSGATPPSPIALTPRRRLAPLAMRTGSGFRRIRSTTTSAGEPAGGATPSDTVLMPVKAVPTLRGHS